MASPFHPATKRKHFHVNIHDLCRLVSGKRQFKSAAPVWHKLARRKSWLSPVPRFSERSPRMQAIKDVPTSSNTEIVQEELCMECLKLNFRDTFVPFPLLVEIMIFYDLPIFQTRTLDEILENPNCPFCKLVLRALTNSPRWLSFHGAHKDGLLAEKSLLDQVKVEFSYSVFGEFLEQDNAEAIEAAQPALAYALLTKQNPPFMEGLDEWTDIDGTHQFSRSHNGPMKSDRTNLVYKAVNRINIQATIPIKIPSEKESRIIKKHVGEANIQIMATDQPVERRSETFLRGRQMNDLIDLRIIEDWIERCNSHKHNALPQTTSQDMRWPSRLINIEEERIVVATIPCQYATLSYVWGAPSVPQLKLTEETLDRLTSIGGLSDSYSDIPLTVKDAMLLCRPLSIPYLWVDALCIQQGTVMEHDEISAMDRIYKFSYLTIVSAAGEDSWGGLPGLRSNSRSVQSDITVIDDVPMGICQPSFRSAVGNSTWTRRAWTLQESILSKRLLIFTPYQIFFQCDGASWCEDSHIEVTDILDEPQNTYTGQIRYDHKASGHAKRYQIPLQDRLAGEESFSSLARNYSVRKMLKQEDALPAFRGILNALSSSLQTEFLHGMPLSYFPQSLLFSTGEYFHGPVQTSRRPEFPSWSWLGWRVDMPDHESEPGSHEHVYGINIDLTPQSMLKSAIGKKPASELKDEVQWYRYLSQDNLYTYFTSIMTNNSKIMRMYTDELPNQGQLTDLELNHMIVGDAIYRPIQDLDTLHDPDWENHSFIMVSEIRDPDNPDAECIARPWRLNPNGEKTAIQAEVMMLSREIIPEGGNSYHSEGKGGGEVINFMVVETDSRGLSRRVLVKATGLKEWSDFKPRATRIFLV